MKLVRDAADKAMIIWMRIFKAKAYQRLFLDDVGELNDAGVIVMAELAKFCRYGQSSIAPGPDGRVDPILVGVLEGRRETLIHIKTMLKITDRQVEEAVEREVQISNQRYQQRG